MKQTFRAKCSKYISFLLAVVLLLGIVYYQYTRMHENTDHHLVYALDDTYIHMAMAKNLAKHGVYGVTKYEFSSSSSSPVWTLLLSLFYVIVGVNEWLPLVLNILIAIMVLYVMYKILISNNVNQFVIAIILIVAIFIIPMSALVFVGMEHLLHALLTLVYVCLLTYLIKKPNRRQLILLYILTPILVMTRMEGYFIVAGAIIVCAIFKKWKEGLVVLLLSLIPLLVYQYISIKQGWQWLPNSIIIRSEGSLLNDIDTHNTVLPYVPASWLNLYYGILWNVESYTYLVKIVLIDVLIGISILLQGKTFKNDNLIMLFVFAVATVCHLMLGKFGFFYRYEAYIVTLSIFMFGMMLEPYFKIVRNNFKKLSQIIILLLIIKFMIDAKDGIINRINGSMRTTPLACKNIYEQQFQMAKFVKFYYPKSTIAINDIGAITFFNDDIRIIDIVGLADKDVFNLLMANNYNAETLHQLCQKRGADIAMMYESWAPLCGFKNIPKEWNKVCDWRWTYKIVCADNVVSFFAIDRMEKNEMRQKMSEFMKELPPSVQVMFTEELLVR
ncbi:MAG TPA: hypothetical protein PK595_01500 [Bacteroidota bacterium]|nr:hypothetical protein [Bacteroidota bacterium]